jgi:hypothetical protein
MTKPASTTETVLELPFKVESIAGTAGPDGAQGLWHSYVISQGSNTITGIRAGTYADVAVELQEMIERLNERRAGKTRSRSKA